MREKTVKNQKEAQLLKMIKSNWCHTQHVKRLSYSNKAMKYSQAERTVKRRSFQAASEWKPALTCFPRL